MTDGGASGVRPPAPTTLTLPQMQSASMQE